MGPDAYAIGKFLGERTCPTCHELCKNGGTDRDAVWLGWTQGSMYVLHGRHHWHHLANTIEPSVLAMWPYVKLLRSLVTITKCHVVA